MRPLVIGPEQLARIAAVKGHAEDNVIPFLRVYRMAHGLERNYYRPELLAELPVGFRVAYGIEEQEHGVFRHLSVSVDGEDRWPHPSAVEMILAAFGLPPLKECAFVSSEPNRGRERRNIVNVYAKLTEEPA